MKSHARESVWNHEFSHCNNGLVVSAALSLNWLIMLYAERWVLAHNSSSVLDAVSYWLLSYRLHQAMQLSWRTVRAVCLMPPTALHACPVNSRSYTVCRGLLKGNKLSRLPHIMEHYMVIPSRGHPSLTGILAGIPFLRQS